MLDRWLARTAEHLVLAMIRKGDPVAVVLPREDFEAYVETAEVMDDEEAQRALREGEQDIRDGRVRPYEDARRDLGLG
jgi:PHD/YefM family antitoxin component YafN of YafNO toxin-antitoxin module